MMRRLSLEEWDGLPFAEGRHLELVEGVLLESPRPERSHQRAAFRLATEIHAVLPSELEVLPAVEVVIAAGPSATVRVPDILVTPADDQADQVPRLAAGDVLLAIEIVSPGSRRTDRILKVAEYARAGIGSYWIVDLMAMTVAVLELDGDTYVTRSDTGIVDVRRPAPIRLDLSEVLARG